MATHREGVGQTTVPGARVGFQCVEGGRPQARVEFHSWVIGYGTAWRPVNVSRREMAEGKRGGRAAAAGLVVGEARRA